MEDLKQGIRLRAYGQTDPVVAYKREGFAMFDGMINAIREETVRRLYLVPPAHGGGSSAASRSQRSPGDRRRCR